MLRVQEDLGYLAKDISEVNAADPENIRIVAQVERPRRGIDAGRRQLRRRATRIF